MKQKNLTMSCIANVSGLQIIILMRLSPQTHSLPEGLGYVHIGQVDRSELSAHIVNMASRKKLTKKMHQTWHDVRMPNSAHLAISI